MASSEALRGRLQKDIDLKSTADRFYKFWRSEAHQAPTATSKNIQAVALHEGEWHDHGAIKIWNYTCEGKPAVFKEKVEFDDKNLVFTQRGIDGDVFDEYKVYICIWKLVPKKNTGAVAKLAIEYERLNEDADIPNKYMDFIVSLTEDIDAHLCAAPSA